MRLTFVGSGDAFGSGGRFHSCFHVETGQTRFLIDCGASSLIALKRQRFDLHAIDTVFVTHFHADHFGGIPFLILDAQFTKRTAPLTIVGPKGLETSWTEAMEAAFAGSSAAPRRFAVNLVLCPPDEPLDVGNVRVQAARVRHGPQEGPFLAYRLAVDGRTIAYTGDTEWTDALIDIGRDADLLIAEAYTRDRKVRFHLDLATLEKKLPLIAPKRRILTHMGEVMLEQAASLPFETAYDGKVVDL